MKIRQGFVTNSSSSSFIVSVTTDKAKEMLELLKKVDSDGPVVRNKSYLQEFIDDLIYDEEFEFAEKLKENIDNLHYISLENYDIGLFSLINVLAREIEGFNIEQELF